MLLTTSPSVRTPHSYREIANVVPFPGTDRREDIGWTATGNRNRLGRELPQYTYDRMVVQSFLAYRTNSMAHRLIEMQCNFVLGNGISVSSVEPATLVAINDWWNDPYNAWPRRIHQRFRDLYTYGEWLHWPLVNKTTGFTFIRDVQPDSVASVISVPDDHGVPDKIFFKSMTNAQTGESHTNATADIIRYRITKDETGEPVITEPTGDVFSFGINRTSDTMRGVGELFPLLDKIDMYDDIIFSRMEKIRNMSHIYFDLTLEGMTESEMRNYLQTETALPPRPGTVYAHNAQAILEMKSPDLKADDHVKDTEVMKSDIISGAGWPGTYFDDPGTAGRAVGAEMAEPALKTIVNLQTYAETLMREEINYYLFQMRKAGNTEIPERPIYTISFSRPSSKDIAKIGPAIFRLSQALAAVTSTVQLLTPEESRAVIVAQINQLGLSDAPLAIELPTDLPSRLPTPQEVAQQAADAKTAALAQQADANNSPNGKTADTKKKMQESIPIALPTSFKLLR